MPRLSRRTALAAPALLLPLRVRAQEGWPSRPVTLLVPYAPGGSNDVVARLLAPQLERRFGQPFIVENRPGGGGSVGMGLVARARPDGQTFLVSSASNHVFHPLIAPDLGYDVREALPGVAMLVDVPNVVAAHPSLGVRTIPELIARVKAMPQGISFASSGVGTSNHLAGELFRLRTGLDMTHVPYRGGGPALTDLLGGTVQLGFMNLPTALPAAREGRLRILAVCTAERVAIQPDIPTVAEQGVADYAVRSWIGLFAPRGTPRPVIERLSEALREAMEQPGLKQRFVELGSEPIWMDPAETDRFVRAEYERWGPVVRAAGVKPE
ncbi:Bug family tripartite tricarboxylate transporter substrate binding protein [Crenalkalicoccus roseus]|uniref:Bug family tripartite tricarboxylate transporter substrate binding protein n=1 Tax=Crenalkalicoccus roseus TaxID=1485588 RepID=UPI00130510DA|nr:tripartite tricarboxylate transporter substrate binding protein [Crenalkalicoccus roseus]